MEMQATEATVSQERQTIRKIKETLKKLSMEQTETKRLLSQPHSTLSYVPMWEKQQRAVMITALLNLYNELRGKEYRHNVRENVELEYNRQMRSWRHSFLGEKLDGVMI